ncbi:transcription antitermination factor NusB [Lacticaseibacillus pantheris]|jgi:N utilization substance protein B|uniref:Transcription antitermination protein NusB n=1 Tax=Lacticaseibacillus pantheris DSM 15945 = JCM 12539 = NBRC 106106 TaxID=1423783 RepID=A0A0R1U776_9LACO|nr:transcription antitermination factor NusB [Lacticaseibacillus pantheris]KRL86834.1 transcription antitermination protein NusB [Lacticaseibacillus pantheris DSM 15945 = JCM 12539 = NBRC 106106]WKF85186.1 transcription antitermination factor NusB [Lacticaseibacillus pantheris]
MLTRHAIREAAFKTLFALELNPDANRDLTYKAALPENEVAPEYLFDLVNGVLAKQDELDAAIKPELRSGWTMARLSKPDLVLLRLGLYEIKFEDDVPAKVAVNEVLELAKQYSDDSAVKFINGVLGNFVQQ